MAGRELPMAVMSSLYVDGRSTIARRYRDIANQLASDRGGAAAPAALSG